MYPDDIDDWISFNKKKKKKTRKRFLKSKMHVTFVKGKKKTLCNIVICMLCIKTICSII